jgi:hypothetical protein
MNGTPAGIEPMVDLHASIRNTRTTAALENKLILLSVANGTGILPAYYSDNCVSLLPGRTATSKFSILISVAKSAPQIEIRGWNPKQQTILVRHE